MYTGVCVCARVCLREQVWGWVRVCTNINAHVSRDFAVNEREKLAAYGSAESPQKRKHREEIGNTDVN